jgi:hypothetical protein
MEGESDMLKLSLRDSYSFFNERNMYQYTDKSRNLNCDMVICY